MSENMLSIRDLKLISADAYARGALGITAETIMDVAADVVDMLIMREHYKISSALHIVGMTAEQYVAVRSKNGKRWWKNGNEIEDEMKEEEEEGEADIQKRIDREVLLPIWEKVKSGTINWHEELDNAKDNRTFAAILDYRNAIERSESEDKVMKTLNLAKSGYLTFREVLECYPDYIHNEVKRIAKKAGIDIDREIAAEDRNYEQYSGRLKKTLAFCKSKGMSLKEVLEFFKENTHWIIRRCAKEIGYENVEVSTPEMMRCRNRKA